MDMTVSTRIDLLRLLLATALVMMCVSTIGAIVGLASETMARTRRAAADVAERRTAPPWALIKGYAYWSDRFGANRAHRLQPVGQLVPTHIRQVLPTFAPIQSTT
jgi:hypothetical protein